MTYCPNCTASLKSEQEAQCPACGALFGSGSAWKPVAYPGGATSQVGLIASAGSGLWITAKVLLSALLLVLAGIVTFSGAWAWGRLAGGAFFVFLSTLPWALHFPRRLREVLVGLSGVLAGGSCICIGLLGWLGIYDLRQDCSRTWRVLGCEIWNALHALGGDPLIGGWMLVMGVGAVTVGAVVAVRGSAVLEQARSRRARAGGSNARVR